MQYKYVLKELSGNICIITMNSLENANKLSIPLIEEMVDGLKAAETDNECRAVILTARSEYFCSGGELGDYRVKSSMEIREFGKSLYKLHTTITNLSKPVIAAVQGHAMGGGMSLVEACDLAVASKDAQFATPESKSGLAPAVAMIGDIQVLSRKGTMEMALLGDSISADRAKEIGLINCVCDKDEVMVKAMDIAKRISQNNPSAMSLCKKLYQETDSLHYDQKVQCAVDILVSLLKSQDAEEALTAREEGRSPVWKNR